MTSVTRSCHGLAPVHATGRIPVSRCLRPATFLQHWSIYSALNRSDKPYSGKKHYKNAVLVRDEPHLPYRLATAAKYRAWGHEYVTTSLLENAVILETIKKEGTLRWEATSPTLIQRATRHVCLGGALARPCTISVSASALLRVTPPCRELRHETAPPFRLKRYPVIDLRVSGSAAKSLSTHPVSLLRRPSPGSQYVMPSL